LLDRKNIGIKEHNLGILSKSEYVQFGKDMIQVRSTCVIEKKKNWGWYQKTIVRWSPMEPEWGEATTRPLA
jgi:hypothetical protein